MNDRRTPLLPAAALAGACLLVLTACPGRDDRDTPNAFNQGAAVRPTPTPRASVSPTPRPSPREVVETTPPPTTPVAPQPTVQDLPYATPVPGKAGYVISPYAPDSGYVDIRGMSPGQQARCPYTQKVFLVP